MGHILYRNQRHFWLNYLCFQSCTASFLSQTHSELCFPKRLYKKKAFVILSSRQPYCIINMTKMSICDNLCWHITSVYINLETACFTLITVKFARGLVNEIHEYMQDWSDFGIGVPLKCNSKLRDLSVNIKCRFHFNTETTCVYS